MGHVEPHPDLARLGRYVGLPLERDVVGLVGGFLDERLELIAVGWNSFLPPAVSVSERSGRSLPDTFGAVATSAARLPGVAHRPSASAGTMLREVNACRMDCLS